MDLAQERQQRGLGLVSEQHRLYVRPVPIQQQSSGMMR